MAYLNFNFEINRGTYLRFRLAASAEKARSPSEKQSLETFDGDKADPMNSSLTTKDLFILSYLCGGIALRCDELATPVTATKA